MESQERNRGSSVGLTKKVRETLELEEKEHPRDPQDLTTLRDRAPTDLGSGESEGPGGAVSRGEHTRQVWCKSRTKHQ